MMAASCRIRFLFGKHLQQSRRCCLCFRGQHSTTTSVARKGYNIHNVDKTVPRGQVSVPKRKKRDSVAVLKALASTVGVDTGAPRYQLVDDPELTPVRQIEKKAILLSIAAGQRAARHFVNEYKEAFDHDAAVPHVSAFQPVHTQYTHTTPSDEALQERIERRQVTDAIEVYDKIKQQGVELNTETQLSFLELLCVYNCLDSDQDLKQTELLYDDIMMPGGSEGRKWKDLNKAEEVFDELPEKTEDAYNWLVRGMLKGQNMRAYEYYQEMLEKGVPVHQGTYHELLRMPSRDQPLSNKWNHVQEMLTKMKAAGMSPTRETFHAALQGLQTRYSMFADRVPGILAEMRALGIEPTLETWGIVVKLIRKMKPKAGQERNIQTDRKGETIGADIREIIDHLRKQEDTDVEVDTEDFFMLAVRACEDNQDAELALKLHSLKMELGHRIVINSIPTEAKYFMSLLMTLCKTETCDTVMEVYSQICPQQDLLTDIVIVEILNVVDVYQEYHHILQLWENFILENTSLLRGVCQLKFFELMARKGHKQELRDNFSTIAKSVFDTWQTSQSSRRQNYMDGKLLGSLIQVFLNNNTLDQAWKCFLVYSGDATKITGDLMNDVLRELFVACIEKRDVEKITSFATIYPTISHETLSWTVEERRAELENILSPQDMKLIDKL